MDKVSEQISGDVKRVIDLNRLELESLKSLLNKYVAADRAIDLQLNKMKRFNKMLFIVLVLLFGFFGAVIINFDLVGYSKPYFYIMAQFGFILVYLLTRLKKINGYKHGETLSIQLSMLIKDKEDSLRFLDELEQKNS